VVDVGQHLLVQLGLALLGLGRERTPGVLQHQLQLAVLVRVGDPQGGQLVADVVLVGR
jgi:hypothetical protein